MPTFTINGRNTPADYYLAYRAYWSKSPTLKFNRVGALLLFIAGAAFVYSSRSDWPGYAMLAAAPLVWFNIIGRLQIMLAVWSNPKLTLPYEATFDDAGVTLSSSAGRGRLAWNHVPRYIENSDIFLIFSTKRSFLIFPKHFFSPKQTESLQTLLRNKIARHGSH